MIRIKRGKYPSVDFGTNIIQIHMKISIIAAVSQNGIIGNNNSLIWHLPADLQFFKKKTTGHTIIMGRNTFESIGGGRPLPNRISIIISRNVDYKVPEGCLIAHSLDAAIALAKHETELFICGGEQIYALALPIASYMYLTRIHHSFEGDTRFPEFNKMQWQCKESIRHQADEKNKYDYSFELYRNFQNLI